MGTYGPKPMGAPAGAILLHVGDDISGIVNAAPVGATFFFEAGVYRGVSLTPKDGQTFIGAEGAILNGSQVLTGWTQSGNLWVIGGQTQQGPAHPEVASPGFERGSYPETVFFNDKPLKPVDALSKVAPGTFYFDYSADKIYLADNPAGHKVEAGKLTDAFHGSAQNVTVKNLVVEKYDSPVIHAAIQGGQGWTIQDNEVRLIYGEGIMVQGNSKIIGNFVHDNGEFGMGSSTAAKNILVDGNEIAHNGFWSGVNPGWGTGGFKFIFTDGLVVRNNYSHDNYGPGMWTDADNIHTLYENNVVTGNAMSGIKHEISQDAIIRNNVLIGNGAEWFSKFGWLWGGQIEIQNSNNVDIYGNKVDMTGANGITLLQDSVRPESASGHNTFNDHVHDNIIVSHDTTGRLGLAGNVTAQQLTTDSFDNNQFYMADVNNRFWWGSTYNFAQFEAATPGNGDTISQAYPNTGGWLNLLIGQDP